MKSKPITLIVRRGALRRFDRLKRDTADMDVDVIWDRRGTSRKTVDPKPPAARQSDRRKRAPYTWEVADFVVTTKPATRRKRSARPKKR
jgi:hypothetical protein